MRYLITIIIIFSLSLFSETISLKKGTRTIKVRSTVLNGSDYLSGYDIAKHIFPNSKYDTKQNAIVNPAYTLRFQPGNVYLILEDWEGSKIIQMGLPAAEYRNRAYLPAKDFFYSLDSLEIFSISSNPENKLFTVVSKGETLLKPLAKYKPRSSKVPEPAMVFDSEGNPMLINLNKTSDPFSETFKKNSAVLSKYLDELNSIKETFITDSDKNTVLENSQIPKEYRDSKQMKPTPYFLPEELIRKELIEVREGKK